jgi:hypothetical protein
MKVSPALPVAIPAGLSGGMVKVFCDVHEENGKRAAKIIARKAQALTGLELRSFIPPAESAKMGYFYVL